MKVTIEELKTRIQEELTTTVIMGDLKITANTIGRERHTTTLSDSTGSVDALIWVDNMKPEYHSFKNKVVEVTGLVTLYEGKVNITISNIKQLEEGSYNISDFIYMLSDENLKKCIQEITNLREMISDKYIARIIQYIYTPKFLKRLSALPAHPTDYYAYNGGALLHIIETTRNALNLYEQEQYLAEMKQNHVAINKDYIIAGALLHEIGIVFSYEPFPICTRSLSGHLVGTKTEGIKLLDKASYLMREHDNAEVSKDFILNMEHIIRTCKGLYKAEEPPRTKEAILIDMAKSTSIKLNCYDATIAHHDSLNQGATDLVVYSRALGQNIVRTTKEVS